ncbi:tRNA-Phe hydroxylase [Aureococcus anophagefferens]|nr:tRNA-Phe hydroxylase [Aureococcus anophagefferens]
MTHLLRRPVATYAFDDLRVLAGPSAADDVDMLRRDVPLLRRVAMCAAAKCARSPAARDALTDLVLKEAPLAVVKALSVAAAHGLSPRCYARAPRDRVPPRRGHGHRRPPAVVQDRHEPCVLAGWAAALSAAGLAATTRCSRRSTATRSCPRGRRSSTGPTGASSRPRRRARPCGARPAPRGRDSARLPVRSALPAASATLLDPSRDEAPPAVFGACFGPPHPEGCSYVAPLAAAAPHYDAMGSCSSPGARAAPGVPARRVAARPRQRAARAASTRGGSVFAALDAAANPFDVTLNAGDLLYLPAFWWHAVRSDDASTTLNYWFALHPDKAADASFAHKL